MYKSAMKNLKLGVGNILADGTPNANDSSITTKNLPIKGIDYTSTDGTQIKGLCNRLSSVLNTVGKIDCTQTTTSTFTASKMNFQLTNGMRFFNLASLPDASNRYKIFLDIDGSRGNGVLGSDVYQYYVNTNGTITGLTTIGANCSLQNNTNGTSSYSVATCNGTQSYCNFTVSYKKYTSGALSDSGDTSLCAYDCTNGQVTIDASNYTTYTCNEN